MLTALVEDALAAEAVVEIFIELDLSVADGADVIASIAPLNDLGLAVDEFWIYRPVLSNLQLFEEVLVLLLQLIDLLLERLFGPVVDFLDAVDLVLVLKFKVLNLAKQFLLSLVSEVLVDSLRVVLAECELGRLDVAVVELELSSG